MSMKNALNTIPLAAILRDWIKNPNKTKPLGPKMESVFGRNKITAESEISIFGERLDAKTPEEDSWLPRIQNWLELGAKVQHLIIEPHPHTLKQLEYLRRKFPSFRSYVVSDASKLTQKEQLEIAERKDFHFTLFKNPNMLWLEERHSAGEPCAFNCEIVRDKHMETDARPRRLREIYEGLRKSAIAQTPPDYAI